MVSESIKERLYKKRDHGGVMSLIPVSEMKETEQGKENQHCSAPNVCQILGKGFKVHHLI